MTQLPTHAAALRPASGVWSPLFRLMAGSGRARRLSIFIFHRVFAEPDPLFPGEPDAARFEAQVRFIAQNFNVLPLNEAVARLNGNSLPTSAACITFDDGYADNLQVALPILQRAGVCATFFISTGFLGGGRMWNDTVVESIRWSASESLPARVLGVEGLGDLALVTTEDKRHAISAVLSALKYLPVRQRQSMANRLVEWSVCRLPEDLMLTPGQVVELYSAGMQIGAHTVTHPILKSLSDDEARKEIADSRGHLQDLLNGPVTLFAYPNGRPDVDYGTRDVRLVRELGFEAAVSTAWGVSSAATDVYQLRRFTPWDRHPVAFGARLVSNYLRHD